MQSNSFLKILNIPETHKLSILYKSRAGYHFVKRALDLMISTIILVISSPLLVLVAALIKLDSTGPVFFVQERAGVKRLIHDGRVIWKQVHFKCYKFRTMVQNADPALHKAYVKAFIQNDHSSMDAIQGEKTETHKLVCDPRITRVGKFLRKFSLDEVPQFINVLIGDMSLVGPRPAIPYEVDEYKTWHFQRLQTKPGITGLWQVTARSSADFDEMVRLDMQYIKKQSFWYDLKIIFMTPWAVLSCRGAK